MHALFRFAAAGAAVALMSALPGCESGVALSEAQYGAAPSDDAVTSSDPKIAKLLALAADLNKQKQYAAAIPFYEQIVTASNEAPAAYALLAGAHARAGQHAEAVKAYRAALAKDPSNSQALLGLGSLQVKQAQYEEAVGTFEQAAQTLKTAPAHHRLAVALTFVGKGDESQTHFKAARALAPNNLDIAADQALSHSLYGNHDDAVTLMRQVAESSRATLIHKRRYMLILAMAGREDEARKAAPPELKEEDIRGILKRAKTLRGVKEPKIRARTLGA